MLERYCYWYQWTTTFWLFVQSILWMQWCQGFGYLKLGKFLQCGKGAELDGESAFCVCRKLYFPLKTRWMILPNFHSTLSHPVYRNIWNLPQCSPKNLKNAFNKQHVGWGGEGVMRRVSAWTQQYWQRATIHENSISCSTLERWETVSSVTLVSSSKSLSFHNIF